MRTTNTTYCSPTLPTVYHTSRQHHSFSLHPLLRLPINTTQVSEKRVKQQAMTALAPGCLNHLSVSQQRLSSTSSPYPHSCTGSLQCEILMSASSTKKRYSSSLTDYADSFRFQHHQAMSFLEFTFDLHKYQDKNNNTAPRSFIKGCKQSCNYQFYHCCKHVTEAL